MLLGIFSDTHFGFTGEDRYEESFSRFKESLRIFHERKVDYILHAGDMFDEAVPTQEVWLKVFECFTRNAGHFYVLKKIEMNGESQASVSGIPIIAIHGTHEHRGRDFANALDVLEESHCLVHVHAGYVPLEKGAEKVFIHGMGGVPEKHAKQVLEKYNPKPIAGGVNILLLHQSFTEFLPFEDDAIATLSLSDLPSGFDLIINGHLHWTQEHKLDQKRFLLTGSAIFTQMKKLEAEMPKGVYLFDTRTKKLEFIPFNLQRKLFYEKIIFNEAKPQEVVDTVQKKLAGFLSGSFEIKPLVRLKLSGSLAKGFTQADVALDLSDFEKKAVLSVSKHFELTNLEKKLESLRALHGEKKSVADYGVDILEKNVLEAGLKDFQTRRVFELLSTGEMEKAEGVVLG